MAGAARRCGVSRRAFLAGGLGTGAAVVGAGALASCANSSDAGGQLPEARYVPFEGTHQTGITAMPVPARSLMAAFSVQANDRADLRRLFTELTEEIRGLMAGRPIEQRDPTYPPLDSGILGTSPPADDLSVVVSVGSMLFDARFGLADRKPIELVEMPFLANDRLDPTRSHGDLLLTLEARHPDTIQFALRQLMRRTRSDLVLRWMIEGYTRGSVNAASGGTPRNLLGFKDGTANLPQDDDVVMDRYVWVGADDPEPGWAAGGSYHVARTIRMFVEFWDRTPLREQEALIGRHKASGAVLGKATEHDTPAYADDPDGLVVPLTAHIRLANPRTPAAEENLILRRGFSFSRGFDGSGQLDQGLAFVCYQRSLRKGFLAVQERLSGEPLEEYIMAVGGGFFFALPGVPSPDRFLGDALLA